MRRSRDPARGPLELYTELRADLVNVIQIPFSRILRQTPLECAVKVFERQTRNVSKSPAEGYSTLISRCAFSSLLPSSRRANWTSALGKDASSTFQALG